MKRYRITKPGASINEVVPTGPYAHTYKRHALKVGEIVTDAGIHYVGSVAVTCVKNAAGISGEFEPNSWGCPSRGYLEEIVDEPAPCSSPERDQCSGEMDGTCVGCEYTGEYRPYAPIR